MNDHSHSEIDRSDSSDTADPLSAGLRRTVLLHNPDALPRRHPNAKQARMHFSVRLAGQEVF